MFKALLVDKYTHKRTLIFIGDAEGGTDDNANLALAQLALSGNVPFSSVSSFDIAPNAPLLPGASTGPHAPGGSDAQNTAHFPAQPIRVCSARIDLPTPGTAEKVPAYRKRRYIPDLPRVEKLVLPEI